MVGKILVRFLPIPKWKLPTRKTGALSSLFSRRAILKFIRFTTVDNPVMSHFKSDIPLAKRLAQFENQSGIVSAPSSLAFCSRKPFTR